MSRYRQPCHRVYMSFMFRQGWCCQFLDRDCKTPLPKKMTFASADKVLELANLGGDIADLERSQMLEGAITNRRGGVYLNLTQAQYERLKRP